jgi:polysaccharide biosynthesis transport protein
VDWRRQVRLLRRWVPAVLAAAIGAGVLAYAVSGLVPRRYEATTTLIVGQSLSTVNPDISQLLASQRLSETYSRLATTRPILDKVIDRLGLATNATDLRRDISASAPTDSTLLAISASADSPARAADLANTIAEELVAAAPELSGLEEDVQDFVANELRATQAEIEATAGDVAALLEIPERTPGQEAQLNSLQARLTSLRSSFATLVAFASTGAANILTVVEPAVPPDEPVWPRPLLNAGLASVLAALIVILIILVAAYFDEGIRDADLVREVLDLPTLAMVPRMPGDRGRSEIYRLSMLVLPKSVASEAYRTLRANLDFTSVDEPLGAIMVTSASSQEGKTVTAANVAVAFAQDGRKVLLVDGDLRKPGVHDIFNTPNARGLSDLLRPGGPGWKTLVVQTEEPNLQLLTTGPLPPNPAEVLGTQRMGTIIDELKAAHDLVIIDSPPLLPVVDAALLSKHVDGTIIVVDARRTRRDAARRAREALERAGAKTLGVVVNRLRGGEEELYAAY